MRDEGGICIENSKHNTRPERRGWAFHGGVDMFSLTSRHCGQMPHTNQSLWRKVLHCDKEHDFLTEFLQLSTTMSSGPLTRILRDWNGIYCTHNIFSSSTRLDHTVSSGTTGSSFTLRPNLHLEPRSARPMSTDLPSFQS